MSMELEVLNDLYWDVEDRKARAFSDHGASNISIEVRHKKVHM